MTSLKPTPPPTRPRLPTPACSPPRSDYELDDVASRVLIRTLQAAIDKNERRKIVGLLKARAWDLAARKVRPGRA